MNLTLSQLIRSRTFLMVLFTSLLNITQALAPVMPPKVLALVDALSGIATIYFRANPVQGVPLQTAPSQDQSDKP